MKKLSIVLLALVVGVFFASTALAFHEGDEGTAEGALGVTGKYTLDAESAVDNDGAEGAWFDDDLELVLRINQGTVTATIDFEISDDEWFDTNVAWRPLDLIDNYYVEWQAQDNLKVKIGEYGISFGHKVLIYADPWAHQVGLTYGLDAVDLGFYLGKIWEGGYDDAVVEDDIDSLTLTASVKNVDFFSKLEFIYLQATYEEFWGDFTDTYLGFNSAFDVGPVGVALEYGTIGSDFAAIDGGNFILADFDLDEITGYGLKIHFFQSNEEFFDTALGFGGGDYYPYMLYTFRAGDGGTLNDLMLIGVSGSHALNDKTTLIAKALVSGEWGPNDDSVGTELDFHAKYKFDDNVTGTFTVATWTPGDGFGAADDTATDLRARFVFTF
jgi:hypothetical protein